MPLISNGKLMLRSGAGAAQTNSTSGQVGVHDIRGVTQRKERIAAYRTIQPHPKIVVVVGGCCQSSDSCKRVLAAVSKIRAGIPNPRNSPSCIRVYVVSGGARQNAAAAICAVVVSQSDAAPFKSISERRSQRQVGLLCLGAHGNPKRSDLRSGEKPQTEPPGDLPSISYINGVIANRMRLDR